MRQQLASEAEKRITNLSKKFDQLLMLTPSEMDYVISQIQREVDAYLARAVDPNHFDRESVEQRLKQILVHAYYDPPSAFVLNSAKGRSLVVVYALSKGTLMGPRATSVTLRAYNAAGERFELADLTGDNLDGYGSVTVKELHSPVSGEMPLLVWGKMTGANGPNIRMRIYTYDGRKFRPTWMPENVWGGFAVQVTEHGFTVDGDYYREDHARHDTYFLAEDGLYR